MSGRYSATYRSEPKNVSVARTAIANFARAFGFNGREVSEIEMAAGEALSNAVQHGLSREGGSFTVRCHCQGNELVIEVRDTGRGFQPATRPPEGCVAFAGFRDDDHACIYERDFVFTKWDGGSARPAA